MNKKNVYVEDTKAVLCHLHKIFVASGIILEHADICHNIGIIGENEIQAITDTLKYCKSVIERPVEEYNKIAIAALKEQLQIAIEIVAALGVLFKNARDSGMILHNSSETLDEHAGRIDDILEGNFHETLEMLEYMENGD